MVSTPASSPTGVHSVEREWTETRSESGCAIWAPDGNYLARAEARARPQTVPAEAYEMEVREVEPRGVLESVWRRQSEIVVQVGEDPPRSLAIDHIVGPVSARRYYLRRLDSA